MGRNSTACEGVEEIPISSRCSLGTLSALDASFPGLESPLLGRKKCHFLLSLTPGFGLGLSVASGEVSGDCADLRRLLPPPRDSQLWSCHLNVDALLEFSKSG